MRSMPGISLGQESNDGDDGMSEFIYFMYTPCIHGRGRCEVVLESKKEREMDVGGILE